MYAGYVVEYGNVVPIFKEPLHPYTQGLMAAFPSIRSAKVKMISIPGQPPDLLDPPPGCRFHPRCPYAMEICRNQVPGLEEIGPNHLVACHLVSKS